MTTLPAIIVEKRVTMWETVNVIHRKKPKRIQKNLKMKQGKYGIKPPNGGGKQKNIGQC